MQQNALRQPEMFDYDPFDRRFTDEPFVFYREMRTAGPVHYLPDSDLWAVCRYRQCAGVLSHHRHFSSRAVSEILTERLPGATRKSGCPFSTTPSREQIRGHLVSSDQPVHTELRRIANRGFYPSIINRMNSLAETATDTLIKSMVEQRSFDVIQDFAARLPVIMIASAMGVDEKHHDDIRKLTDIIIRGANGSTRHLGHAASGAEEARHKLGSLILDFVHRKQQAPDNSIISALISAHEDGSLSVDEACGLSTLLLFAGAETTTHLIGNTVHTLLHNPKAHNQLVEDPSLIPQLMEEINRWNSPVQYTFRRAIREVHIDGTRIPAGANVVVLLGSGNRDHRRWGNNAEQFSLHRNPRRHLGWGHGIHFCLGAPLARMQTEIALRKLIPLLRRARCTNSSFQLADSMQFRGYRSLTFELK